MFILFFYFIIFFFHLRWRSCKCPWLSLFWNFCHHRRSSSAANFMAIFGRSFCEPTKILNVRKLLIRNTFTGTEKRKNWPLSFSVLSVILKSSQWKCSKKNHSPQPIDIHYLSIKRIKSRRQEVQLFLTFASSLIS